MYSHDGKAYMNINVWAGRFVFNFNTGDTSPSPSGDRPSNTIILGIDQLDLVRVILEGIIIDRTNEHKVACQSARGNNYFDVRPNYNSVEKIDLDNSFTDNQGNEKNNGNLSIYSKEVDGVQRIVFAYVSAVTTIEIILVATRSKKLVNKLTKKSMPGYDANDAPLYSLHYLLAKKPTLMTMFIYNGFSTLYRLLMNNNNNNSQKTLPEKYDTKSVKDSDIF